LSCDDQIENEVDRICLWHIAHCSKLNKEGYAPRNPPEAISLGEEGVVLVPDTEAEGLAPEEDDNQDPPMDLNTGCPDYRTMWVAAAQFKNKSKDPCSTDQLCGQSHYCVRCRADETMTEYNRWGMTDQRIAAHLIHHVKQNLWKPLSTNNIWDFLMDLDGNLKCDRPLQKELSHYGALRVSDETFKK
jgi:hypothetical protein